MDTYTVDVERIKQYIKLNGRETSLTDTELGLLTTFKINDLERRLGVHIQAHNNVEFINRFEYMDTLILEEYPVLSINHLIIDGAELKTDEYTISYENGIIYLNNPYHGNVKVEYTSGFTQDLYNVFIESLIGDLISYDPSVDTVSSMSEGDTSISYDTSSLLGSRINSKIDDLRNTFCVKARLI